MFVIDSNRHDLRSVITSISQLNDGALTSNNSVNLIPCHSKRWGRKIMLAATHLGNTVGIGMAAYAGKPDDDAPGGVKSENLNKIGNMHMFLVMVVVLFWLWPATKQVLLARQEVNYKASKALVMAAGPGIVLQLIRLSYSLTYAFNRIPSLSSHGKLRHKAGVDVWNAAMHCSGHYRWWVVQQRCAAAAAGQGWRCRCRDEQGFREIGQTIRGKSCLIGTCGDCRAPQDNFMHDVSWVVVAGRDGKQGEDDSRVGVGVLVRCSGYHIFGSKPGKGHQIGETRETERRVEMASISLAN